MRPVDDDDRAALAELMPAARRIAERDLASGTVGTMEARTRRGAEAMGHFTLRALAGVRVAERRGGGWSGDLLFEGMPPGMADVVGTPEATPLSSREEALEFVTQMVAFLCVAAEETASFRCVAATRADGETAWAPDAGAGFFLYRRVAVLVTADMLDWTPSPGQDGDAAQALAELDARLGLTGEDGLEEPDRETVEALLGLAVRALREGITRWPRQGMTALN